MDGGIVCSLLSDRESLIKFVNLNNSEGTSEIILLDKWRYSSFANDPISFGILAILLWKDYEINQDYLCTHTYDGRIIPHIRLMI